MISVLVFCAVVGLFLYWGAWSAKKRTAGLQTANQQLGLTPLGNVTPAGGQTGLHLFTLGRTHTTSDLFGGEVDDLETQVFDYAYTEREPNGDYTTTQQTVAAFRRPGVSMPSFQVLPSNLMQRAVAGLNKDVRIDDEEFRKMYLVRGAETVRIQAIFTFVVVEAFKRHDHKRRWHVDGSGEWLLVYVSARRTAAQDQPEFLRNAAMVAHTIFRAVPAAETWNAAQFGMPAGLQSPPPPPPFQPQSNTSIQ